MCVYFFMLINVVFRSKSATYVRDGTPSTVSNIDEAKQKIMECLNELSNIRVFLNTTSPTELDMENQLQLIGSLANKRDCCDKTFPHIHATLNGIPIVLQLNEVTFNLQTEKNRETDNGSF